ncbi:MAG TPA: AAA family ATPase, partial [Mycobacteriales bacterium]|nr:AAA family ATPase [Mycobacteriales bacterium]
MTRPGDPHGERRLVTALFADLTGYTALCRELDPEEVVATVQPLMAGLRFAVRAEDGIVISTAGDGLFAVFGVPAGHEDDAARAMRTADRMRALVVESNRAQPAVRVPEVHIGVASGEVLVLAGEDPGGWSLTGSAVNLAARLCDLAAAGEVLVDQDSRALAGPGASYSEHRVLTVRGITEPVPAALLATPPSRQATRPRQAFIGRETEGRALDALLEQVLATGAGRIARITGEPGIGKTRLVEEWLSGRPDVTGCYGQCAAAGLHSPLGPLVSAVVTTGEADLTDELLAAGVADASQLARRLSGVATGTGPGVDVPTVLAGVRQLLEARGRRGGVVVVLDDTHEAGQELTEALAELSQWPLRGPVLILAVGRTDPRGSDLVLEGLPEPAASTLLAEALGGELARSPAAEIVARAAGNPLYLVQTAAWLRDAGAVVVAGSGVELVRSEVVDELPGTLRTFIAARLDALPGAERLFVLQASTAAEELDSDTVRVLAPDADPGALDSLLARGLLRTSGPGRWRFGHPLVREVAYASLTRSTRARLHARQLRAFELAGHPSLLAHHAERWVRAVPARDSGQRREAVAESLRRSRTHAEMLYRVSARTAFEALSRVLAYTDEADPRDGTGVLSLASRCLIELGDYPEALRMAGRAVECSRVLGDDPIRIDALLNHGDALCRLWRMAEARQQLDAAIAVTERIGDEPARGRALALLANASAAESLERFLEITEAAYLVLDAAGDAEGAAQSARILAWNLGPSGDPAFTRWLAATEAATARDDVRGQAWLSRIRIADALWHDRYQDALDEAGRTAQLAEDCGARDMLSDAHIVAME